ncbi:hypothetical protein TWF718_005063 [Orbilia javanica]|uniref:Uncharacterized protein n=1 Tax=Orbilia javanica TaxID=47235 RepID=A0AAN8N995_9PEZI
MHFSTLFTTATVAILGFTDLASGHCVFIDAWGSVKPGIHGHGLGFGAFTPRKGTALLPHQRDVAVFDQRVVHHWANKNYMKNGCGCTAQGVGDWYSKNKETLWKQKGKWLFNEVTPAGAFINVKKQIDFMALMESKGTTRKCLATGRETLKTGIPKVAAGKRLTILAYQVNLDGAGPFECKIDFKGNGHTWTKKLDVVSCKVDGKDQGKNCPGWPTSSFNLWTIGKVHAFEVQLPKHLNCQGKYGPKGKFTDICLVRCENKAANGPFGGCVPVQQIRPKAKIVTKKVGTKKIVTTIPITKFVTKKVIVRPQTVKKTVVKVIRVTVKPSVKSIQRVRVTTVTAARTVIYIIRGGVRKPTTVTKGEVVTVTETVPAPTTSNVTTTIVEDEEFEDEVVEGGKSDDDDNEGEDKEAEDEPEDEGNKISGKEGNTDQNADQKPSEKEIEAAIGGEDISDEDREKLKDEKVSKEDKKLLDEAGKAKGSEFEYDEDVGYFEKHGARRG